MKRICGFRPTGRLHLGHYFAVVVPGREEATTVLVATYHASERDEAEVARSVETLRRLGVKDVKIQAIDLDLYFRLLNLAPVAELERMTQFKSTEGGSAHLLTYPVLMAHDIVGYDEVVVGDDQAQHLEFAARLLRRYNRKHGKQVVRIPKACPVAGRIRDLRNPSRKMSKSSPAGCIFLDDSPEAIRAKIMKAVTTPEGLDNLRDLYQKFGGGNVPATNLELKERLVELLCKAIG